MISFPFLSLAIKLIQSFAILMFLKQLGFAENFSVYKKTSMASHSFSPARSEREASSPFDRCGY